MSLVRKTIGRIGDLAALDRLGTPLSKAVHRATASTEVKNALSGNWLGHQLHPMLTDVPIGAWLMASAIDFTGGPAAAPAARRLVGLGLMAAVPTAASGASDWSDSYGGDQRVGLVHGLANLTATGVHLASWVARGQGHRRAGIALSTAGLGLTAGAGYLGGYLSFGRGVGVNNTSFEPPVTNWTDVAALGDLEAGKPLRVVAGQVPVVLVRQGPTVRALSATCTHASGPLDGGKVVVEDGQQCLVCPWHGSVFRLEDGAVVRGPASVRQPLWDVQIADDRVRVKMADPVPDH